MSHHNSLKMASNRFSQTVTIVNQRGLHARPAAKLTKLATRYQSSIKITHKETTACAKDILDILTLAASQGSEITIETYGADDASDALQSVVALIEYGFDEDQSICPIKKETV